MAKDCFVCSQPLTLNRARGVYECTNSRCDAHGTMLPCRICGEFAVGGTPRACRNPRCATANRVRLSCGDCGQESRITISRIEVCLNPDCPRNEDLFPCSFCGKESVVRGTARSTIVACTNRDCSACLNLVRACPVCGDMAFNLHEGRCHNATCPTQGRRVDQCPACGKKRFFGKTERDFLCANAECRLYYRNSSALRSVLSLSDPGLGGTSLERQEIARGERADAAPGPGTDSFDETSAGVPDPTLAGSGEWAEDANGIDGDTLPPASRPQDPSRLAAELTRTSIVGDGQTVTRVINGANGLSGALGGALGDGMTVGAATADFVPAPGDRRPVFDRPSETSTDDLDLETGEVTFPRAFEYLRTRMLAAPGATEAPLYLVVGLSGVGKTCYLTMLGQVLQARQFFSPRPDITPQMVRIDQRYRQYIRDLVFDFANPKFDQYIAHGSWPPPDIPDATKHFLVTQLLTPDGKLAKLATLEISGEHYQEFLPEVHRLYQDDRRLQSLNENQRVIWDLFQLAEGIVILLDVSPGLGNADERDGSIVYGGFFQALAQWKEVQVRRSLAAMYDQFWASHEANDPLVLRLIKAQQSAANAPIAFETFADEIRHQCKQCIATLEDHGVNRLFAQHFRVFEEFRTLYRAIYPDDRAMERLAKILETDPDFQNPNNQLKAFEAFLRGFFQRFADGSFLQQVYETLAPPATEQNRWQIFLRWICWHYALDESALQFLDEPVAGREEAEGTVPFEKLKFLSVVFTKTDKDYAVYPASNFPRVVNVDWAAALPRLGNYLTLSDGYLKYYNASVSGYSIKKDATFQIGRRGTLTPINIAEPLLDMLAYQGHSPLVPLAHNGGHASGRLPPASSAR